MAVLSTSNLAKSFGPDDIFEDISVSVAHGAKVALVGPNGAGKTTLINILSGFEPPSDGIVHLAKGTRIGYLPQRPELSGDRTVWEEMLTVFEDLIRQEAELAELEARLADANDNVLEQYGKRQAAFEQAGGYTYELDISRILQGLGFSKEEFAQPLNQLSGGQTTRALLARLLLENPDLLTLDEPTNHLDIAAIEWLESYLRTFEGAVLMVSHDRYFMDRVVAVIWELEWGEIEVYQGNYSHYLEQREERYERRLKEYETFQEYVAKEETYIKKHIASQNTAQAKGKRRRLERLLSGTDIRGNRWIASHLTKRPPRRRHFSMRMKAENRTGDKVLMIENLSVGYDQPLFKTPDFTLYRGEVAAIIGANGSGKTTYLRTIMGQLAPQDGAVEWGAQVKIGYFSQGHEDLSPENTLLDELSKAKEMRVSEARNYLASYLFTGDDVFRKVSTLSGGERGRLALAKLALSGANVLLLDEPTNHLDLPSQEILQDVLANFGGTIIMVSHDRYIIDALASQIWMISSRKMEIFEGSYTAYQEQKNAGGSTKSDAQGPSQDDSTDGGINRHASGLNPYRRQKRIEELEGLIQRTEARLEEISRTLSVTDGSNGVETVARLGQEYDQSEAQLQEWIDEWAALSE